MLVVSVTRFIASEGTPNVVKPVSQVRSSMYGCNIDIAFPGLIGHISKDHYVMNMLYDHLQNVRRIRPLTQQELQIATKQVGSSLLSFSTRW